jgi:hypothetical protein
MLHTLLKAKDDLDLIHNVIVARKLGTLKNIVAINSVIIARRVISLMIFVYAIRIDPLMLFILLFSPLLYLSSTQPVVPGSSSNITPEQVQHIIISALSALGLQGKKHLTSPWLIDFVASNYMTGSPVALHDVCKYDGEQHIQIVDDSTLSITAVGNLRSSFTNDFVSPDLSTNLSSVGQLVEENCSIILIVLVVLCRIKHWFWR